MKQKKYIILAAVATLFLMAALGVVRFRPASDRWESPTVSNPFASSPSPLLKDSDFKCDHCNVVIVGMTNVRRDHMGMYGYSRDTTPNIDAFAKRSVVFENAFTPTSWTLPVVASILTSLYPFQHGTMGLSGSLSHLDGRLTTLADVLKRNGYRTATFTGGRDLLPSFGVTSRFDENFYPDADLANSAPSAPNSLPVQLGSVISTKDLMSHYGPFGFSVPKAIEWMQGHKDKPFFTYVQGFDAHCPFASPQKIDRFTQGLRSDLDFRNCYINYGEADPVEVNGKKYFTVLAPPSDPTKPGDDLPSQLISEEDVHYMSALYDGKISEVDAQVGRLLDFMEKDGLLDNTIVILLAEHGDMFGKHGRFMRGGPLRGTYYDDVLHVPLVFYFPKNSQKGIHRPQIAELTDLAPTVLDALSLEIPPQFAGSSLRTIATSDAPGRGEAFAGSVFFPGISPFFTNITLISALRTPDWKLIYENVFKPISGLEDKPLSTFLDPRKEDVEVLTQLFDMKNDPEELTDVSAKHADIVESLRREMEERIRQF
ncbi:sulfatase-like hydrolase/transferase [Candidatus Peregrinibacteria bacterium]|nr:sulfatase-like hydrolase/transferase [Candidatus Peregrinibacteria bacterium]